MPSYLQHHFKVTLTQFEFARAITDGCSKRTYKLFCHILVCNIARLTTHADSLFIPIAWRFVDRRLKRANWKDLQQRELVEVKPYNRTLGLSREFKVKDWALSEFLRLGDLPAAEYIEQLVDLFTGRPSKRVDRSLLNDANRHPQPELVRKAIKVFDKHPCPFNLSAIEQYLQECNAALSQYQEGSKEYQKQERRYRANLSCRNTVLQRMLDTRTKEISFYTSAYVACTTGRIHQIGGALQTCSRLLKHYAYSGVPNLYNYDLRASQINILIQFFDDADLDSSWLTSYRDTGNSKTVYAERAGLPVDAWKKCLIALVMGAHLPRRIGDYEERDNAILKELAELANRDEGKIKELLAGFTEVVMPLVKQLERWHEWLLNFHIHRKKKYSPHGWFIKNEVGMRLYLAELPMGKLRWLAKARVAAFLLQGVEACTIHHLTLLGNKYGYKPVSNEHDGLITIGQIPMEAVLEASSLSGFRNARLEIKEFV